MSTVRCAVAVLPMLACLSCASNDDVGDASTGGFGTGGVAMGGSSGAGAGAVAGSGAGGVAGSGAGSGTGGIGGTGAGAGAGGSGASGMAGGGSGGVGGSGTAGAGAGGGGAGAGGAAAGAGGSGGVTGPVSLTIFDEVVFYDAYANLVSEPVPQGVRRLRNDLFTHKLTEQELGAIQNTLRIRVVIGALCDNYDRIGSVGLSLVPKGASSYDPDDVARLEVGRYVTPFMDKNRQPDEVPYVFTAHNLVPVLRDPELRAQFDFWFELEVFGVPYAANEEVSGCANRNDVFRGTLILDSDSSAVAPAFDELIPLAHREPFNNYRQGASDMVGTTRKTLEFELDAATADTQLVLITSNHGANSGGEEYVRRDHFVTVDDVRKLTYKPGRTSCEPFRMYNTQANGIYGQSVRSDSSWQSFSNWCPGDVIDTRIVPLGPMSAGRHEFVIDVPDAEFVGGEGDFPFSLYVQSRRN